MNSREKKPPYLQTSSSTTSGGSDVVYPIVQEECCGESVVYNSTRHCLLIPLAMLRGWKQ